MSLRVIKGRAQPTMCAPTNQPTNTSMKIINLTPHAVTIGDRTIQPSGTVARVSQRNTPVGDFDGIPLVVGTYGDTVGLPDQQEGVFFIVSALLRVANPNRRDIGSPADLVRNAEGQIVGCLALEVNP